MVYSCLHFLSIAEAFAGRSLPMRSTVLAALGAAVDSYQKSNMDALRMSLALEDWQPVSPSNDSSVTCMKQQLTNSPYLLPAYGQSGNVTDFAAWLEAGNPFTQKAARSRAVGGEHS